MCLTLDLVDAFNGANLNCVEPSAAVPIAGVFELEDGKIKIWREYLDLRTAEEGTGLKF